jgi:hypothetical protein
MGRGVGRFGVSASYQLLGCQMGKYPTGYKFTIKDFSVNCNFKTKSVDLETPAAANNDVIWYPGLLTQDSLPTLLNFTPSSLTRWQ